MRFGVNYTPSHGWFHSWLHQDWDSVARDLDAIASLGLDHVRIFPLWPVLQPNRTWINQSGLDDLRHMAQLASDRGLDVYSDVLQGHMSSFDFLPSWLITWHKTNMFTDCKAIEAQSQLVSAVYDALADVPRFRGLTVGNECNQFEDASHPMSMPANAEQINAWLHAMIDPIESEASRRGQIVVHGENDAVWYEEGHAFTPTAASSIGDVSVIHSWAFNGTAQRYGSLSEATTRHAEYLMELSKAFATQPDRQVWLQEIGAPGNVINQSDAPEFCRRSVEHALDCENTYAITWWCSHDVDKSMGDFPPFEHDLGLFDQDGNLKPLGVEFSRLVKDYSLARVPKPRRCALVVRSDEQGEPVMKSACAPGGSLFDKWMELSDAHERPAIVSSKQAQDAEFLANRGIQECITVPMQAGIPYNAVSDPSLG
ncbi:glycoside hydrolase 5 family protein [Bifidobacterium bombi]|uniref:Glycosyl hydrolase n=1 Tax=Bifidobacterium bombi DSM 19703 TaxID=1341695 RepID=A0A080N1X9_9BIFI|nr:glycosyl hydrolase [Bifidobacterium bombi]KFF30878.1 hypothetical protein BBOMB_0195 [Bifidobacterium bombi DSM 19703]